ncbi:nucleosome assembly protein 1-like 1 [Drosophila madeirensis]|uniref:Nucleosome assembly protein 1-like 1 n=1 Tax=Drosophila madeirensis TaxID=30013 RepID=A0AAU9G499_DROMD
MDTPPEGKDVDTSGQEAWPAGLNSTERKQHLRNTVQALFQSYEIEEQYYQDILEMEKDYELRRYPILEKRKQIVSGTVDPAGQMRNWQEAKKRKVNVESCTKCIPRCRLIAFGIISMLSEWVEPHDQAALHMLTDVSVVYQEDISFRLHFHCDDNQFFRNTFLAKRFIVDSSVYPDQPLPVLSVQSVIQSVGCQIAWKKNMNLTVETIEKKQNQSCTKIIN